MTTYGEIRPVDSEMAEQDEEKVVTMMDVLKEQEDFEEDANAVLGASDDKYCTYTLGYINRQALYACITCCADAKDDATKRAGVCLACSLKCHEDHELIELYTKRSFRCDCGNPKFKSHPCQFTPNKTDLNEENSYNQNFSGLYCVCHRPYPDPEVTEEDEMIQCIICEDWLHTGHLDASVPDNDQYAEMICKSCMQRNEFLHNYSDLVVNTEIDVVDVTDKVSVMETSNGVIEVEMRQILNENKTESECKVEICETIEKEDAHEKVNEIDSKVSMETEREDAEKDESQDKINNDTEKKVNDDEVKGEEKSGVNEVSSEVTSYTSLDKICVKEASEIGNDSSKDAINNDKAEQKSESPVKNDIAIKERENDGNIENPVMNDGETKITEPLIDDETMEFSNENKTVELLYEDKNMELLNENNPVEPLNKQEAVNDEPSEIKASIQLNENENMELSNENKTAELVNDKSCVETRTVESLNEDNKAIEILAENKPVETINEQDKSNESKTEKNAISIPEKSTFEKSAEEIEKMEEDRLLEDPEDTGKGVNLDTKTADENIRKSTMGSSEPVITNNIVTSQDTEETEDNSPKALNTDTTNTSASAATTVKQEDMPVTDSITEAATQTNNAESSTSAIDNTHSICSEKVNVYNGKEHYTKVSIEENEKPDIKRKLSDEEVQNELEAKKIKLGSKPCVKPKETKGKYKGATFWPAHFRQKLCTCSECLSMYKDLSVLFLIDPEDTVSAYEHLGKEKSNGKPASEYEKGLAALSSLDRIQQINALTEYNKMRDKLLDFLKSFKDRKEIVKEEDIKAFFAGMKPKREPDGVYFCR